MPGDVGLVAKLLSEVFGFAVNPDGLEKMKLEHQIEVIRAGIKIAVDNGDDDAADALFEQFRELSKRTGS